MLTLTMPSKAARGLTEATRARILQVVVLFALALGVVVISIYAQTGMAESALYEVAGP